MHVCRVCIDVSVSFGTCESLFKLLALAFLFCSSSFHAKTKELFAFTHSARGSMIIVFIFLLRLLRTHSRWSVFLWVRLPHLHIFFPVLSISSASWEKFGA